MSVVFSHRDVRLSGQDGGPGARRAPGRVRRLSAGFVSLRQ
jgi:hypothetical protein